MDDENYEEVRCLSNRPHTIRGVEYDTCGTFLNAINKDSPVDSIYHCHVCGAWFRVKREKLEDIVLTFERLEKRRFKFIQPLRTER